MEKWTDKYRISIYEELVELSSNKIYIVKSSLDDKIYIKKYFHWKTMIYMRK